MPARFAEVSERDRLLLRAAVGDGTDALAAWHRWIGDGDLGDLPYPEGRVLTQVFANLRTHELATELPARMRGKYRWVWSANQLRARTVSTALEGLARQGIPTMLLKGAGLLAAGWCAWGAREMGDVDVLVPAGQAGRAASALQNLNWWGLGGVDADYLARRLVRRRHGWNFAGPPSGEVDLHWHIVDGQSAAPADGLLWSGRHPATFGGAATSRLDAADQLVHTIVHAAHGEPAHRLVWLTDVALLLERADPDRVARVSGALGVRAVMIDGLERAGWALETPRATNVARRLRARSIPVGERVRALASAPAGDAARPRHRLRAALARPVSLRRPVASTRALLGRQVEPGCVRHPVASTVLALAGRPRRVEVPIIRAAGPLARPPRGRRLPVGVWIEVATGSMLDVVGGPGWAWPEPSGSGVWAEGSEARLVLAFERGRGQPVVLDVLLGSNARFCPNRSVVVSVNARPVAEWELEAGGEGPYTIKIPAWLADWCDPLEITFRPGPAAATNDASSVIDAGRIVDTGDRHLFLQLRALRARGAETGGDRRHEVVAAWDDVARGPDAAEAINPLGSDPDAYGRSGEEAAARLVALIGDDPDLVVADFGAGDGRVTRPLARHYRRIVAIDSSPAMLERLRARCPGVETTLADGTDATVLPRDVDAVIALAVLIHHCHVDATRILGGLTSMLRPGGRLLIDLALYEVGREPEHWTDVSVWTRAELEMVVADLGLEIVSANVSPGEFDGVHLGPNHGKVQILRKVTR